MRATGTGLLCCAVLLAAGLGGFLPAEQSGPPSADTSAGNASSRFTQLEQSRQQAREKHDTKALLFIAQQMAELVHYSGPSVEELALAYARARDKEHALEMLRDFVAMGQVDVRLATRPEVSDLKSTPRFEQLLRQMEQNQAPILKAAAVAEFLDPGLLPEDVDYDVSTKSFLATSVLQKKIVRLTADGSQTNFAVSPNLWPMLAIKIDTKRGLVWATEVALDQFAAAPEKDWGRSALIGYRLADGRVLRRIEGPARSALGDMTLLANGDVIVSDGAGGGVYRLRTDAPTAVALERLDRGDFISPQTPAALPDGRHVLVADYARGIGTLDLATKQVRWVETRRRHALQGIDGLYCYARTLIAVQNGSSPERVVLFRLDPEFTRVVSEEVIESATPGLGDPTHGVIIGDEFYYIANSGWDALDDAGNLKSGAHRTRARMMKTQLKPE